MIQQQQQQQQPKNASERTTAKTIGALIKVYWPNHRPIYSAVVKTVIKDMD